LEDYSLGLIAYTEQVINIIECYMQVRYGSGLVADQFGDWVGPDDGLAELVQAQLGLFVIDCSYKRWGLGLLC